MHLNATGLIVQLKRIVCYVVTIRLLQVHKREFGESSPQTLTNTDETLGSNLSSALH